MISLTPEQQTKLLQAGQQFGLKPEQLGLSPQKVEPESAPEDKET